MRYLCKVKYNGTSYLGWQKQDIGPSIQEEIENILSQLLDENICIYASGRTDKGVHAYGQMFHFDATKEIKDLGKFIYALNRLLSNNIRIDEIKEVDESFHARFSCLNKTYLYKTYIGKDYPFYQDYSWIYYLNVDVNKLDNASKLFLGEHNFINFTKKKEDEKEFVRTINFINIIKNNDFIEIEINGNGFMRSMVRMIVGVLFANASGIVDDKYILDLLDSNERKVTKYNAPANGLYLKEVFYE